MSNVAHVIDFPSHGKIIQGTDYPINLFTAVYGVDFVI